MRLAPADGYVTLLPTHFAILGATMAELPVGHPFHGV
jgi:hypothetical protein